MRMHIHQSKPQPWVLPVTIVCLVFGGFLAVLYSSSLDISGQIDTTQMNREQLALVYAKALEENQQQQIMIEDLQSKQNDLTDGALNEENMKRTLQTQLDELRIYAGTTAVKGPGIIITMDDTGNVKESPVNDSNASLKLVHDTDLQTLVNELRSAGAEAIEINEQRITASTSIRCAGSVIQVNFKSIAAPFVIKAIGKPETLYGSVNMPSGALYYPRAVGIAVTVTKKEEIKIKAASNLVPLEYAKPMTGK